MKLFVDLDGYPNPGECFGSQRPDIVIINGKELIVIELSVCYETRTEEARNFKKRRYQSFKSDLSIEWEKLNIIYVEITTLGFVSRNIKDFAKFVKPLGISYERMIGNKTNDLILNLTPENVTQHSRIVTTTRKGSSTPTKMSKIIGRQIH